MMLPLVALGQTKPQKNSEGIKLVNLIEMDMVRGRPSTDIMIDSLILRIDKLNGKMDSLIYLLNKKP